MDEHRIVRTYFQAYETKDRALLESVLADNFSFKSPIDDPMNRLGYFERCWPGSEDIKKVHVLSIGVTNKEILVHYQLEMYDGRQINNVDTFLIANGKIFAQEAFYGDPPKQMSRKEFAELNAQLTH